jgi:hypothetical protein
MTEQTLSFFNRLVLAWKCFFRIWFDEPFAVRVLRAADPEADRDRPSLPPATPAPRPTKAPGDGSAAEERRAPKTESPNLEPALQLLALFQREGRLVDFLQQDVTAFSDSDIGAAARVVHDGCRKALAQHAKIVPVRSEEEGAKVSVEPGFDAAATKLTGNVRGSPPHRGVLRHRGWRADSLSLPRAVGDHDVRVLAQAEIEL